MKSLVLAEKPSVARDIARVLNCHKSLPGAIEGSKYMSRPRQHRHLKRKNSILFLVFLDFPHFFIHSGWQDTLF